MARIGQRFLGATAPVWAGDFLWREHLLPGGVRLNAAAFPAPLAPGATITITLTEPVVVDATTLTVQPLTGSIPADTTLTFGAALPVWLTLTAEAGDTTITIDPAMGAIPTGATATYVTMGPGVGAGSLPSGTLVGRTYAERDAGVGFGPAAATDDEIYLIAFDVTDLATLPDAELYRHGSLVKENFLPGWAALAAPLKAAVRARYECTVGVEGA